METPPIPLIKGKIDTKFKKCYVKIKFHSNSTLENSGMNEFIMELFGNGKPEEFMLLKNYKMMLDASVSLKVESKNKYIRRLMHGKAIRESENIYVK